MTKPDWSKAPEGATHFGEATGDWYKIGKGFYWWSKAKGWLPILVPELRQTLSERPAQWRGPEDGLPPVGQEVRVVGDVSYGHGEEGEVAGHFEDCAIVRLDWGLGCFVAGVLGPVKTQEQRELEQLQADIDEAFETNATLSEFLHAKGYRKS